MNNKRFEVGEEIILSLTGKDSHKVKIESGQGSFAIGNNKTQNYECDVIVDESLAINWETFEGFYTDAGYENKNNIPFGDWPRFFFFSGNDIGFIDWSFKRKIEDFSWQPQKSMKVDFTNAKIYKLCLETKDNILELSLGENIYSLHLKGNLEKYKIKKCIKLKNVSFFPIYNNNISSYKLPKFKALKDITDVSILVSPLSPPFDCNSLLQFPNIDKLFLIGNVTNLNSLKQLKNIEYLGIWDSPNLTNMPELSVWEKLSWFVALNIDETLGKRFKKEISMLKKSRDFEFSSISKLRNSLWFETNYALPFREWEDKKERKAIKSYKKCLKDVKNSSSVQDIEKFIVDFVREMNNFNDIDTQEREDIYLAISIIIKNSPISVEREKWEAWFNNTRDF